MEEIEPIKPKPVAPRSHEEAQALTQMIQAQFEQALDAVWRLAVLLDEAYERQVWRILGYSSWKEYARAHFSLQKSRLHMLRRQGRAAHALLCAAFGGPSPVYVSNALEGPLPLASLPHISARQSERLNRNLSSAIRDVQTRVSAGVKPERAVAEVIAAYTVAIKESRLHRAYIAPGLDALAKLAKPRLAPNEFLAPLSEEERFEVRQHLGATLAWLATLRQLLEADLEDGGESSVS